jgi:Putative phage tail protein
VSTRTALTVVGTVVGAYFGYPQLGMVAGSLIGSAVDPQQIQGPKIGEVSVQTSAEGVPRTIVYGVIACYGNIIQTGPAVITEVEESQGKGGPEVTSERASRTYAIRVCEGPVLGYRRIWEDNKLVYDVRPESQMIAESEKWAQNKVFYLGDETQLPDPTLVSTVNPDTPAYRGSGYVVFILEDLTDRRGSIPQYRFEVASAQVESETVEIPVLYVDGPTNAQGLGGGLDINAVFMDEFPVDSSAGVHVQPLMLFTFVQNQALPNSPVRAQLYFTGDTSPRFDTGWIGNPIYQTELNTVLSDQGYGYMQGPLTAWSAPIVQETRTNTPTTGFMRFWRARTPSSPANFQMGMTWVYPTVDAVPLGYIPYGTFFGVGQAPDESLFRTSWGPTSITFDADGTYLSNIVADIHERCGSHVYDVSELTDLVAGLGLAGDYTGASAIDVMRPVYNFDKSIHDGSFYYPKRGAAVIETLTVDDLTEIPDTTKREQALDVPQKFHLRYQHAASGYAPVKASAPRTPSPDFLTSGEASFEIPVVLDEDEAAQAADKMYKIFLAEMEGTTEIVVPVDIAAKYADANCIGLSLRGRTDRYRIEEQSFSDWKIKLTLKPDRQSAYTSNLTGVPIPEPTLPPSTIVGATELAVMDIPARIDSEDSLGIVLAVDGALPPWYGARLQRSLDGGASYSTIEDTTIASVMGVLVDPVADASQFTTDRTNTVRVRLYRATHSMETISQESFMREGGAFALENVDGSWEILQARDWDDEGDQVFAGTVLHRGRLNSVTNSHAAGQRFVRLDRPKSYAMQSSWINTDVTHRAISLGDTADDTTNDTTQTYVGRSQIEWPVVHLQLERDSSGVVSGTWAPRHRFGSDVAPVASINFRGYRVTLTDGSSTVTFDVATPEFTYDASSLSQPVTVSVSALNRITGAGPVTSGSI